MLAKVLRSALALGYMAGVAGAHARRRMAPCILMYHGTPRHSAGAFARQLRFLRRHFDVVPLGALVASFQSEERERPRVALTFDDGLRNNVTVAYPLLKRLGLPATFFVCPQLAGSARWIWNHEARQRLQRLNEPARLRLAERLGHRIGAVHALIDWMKSLDLAARARAEACIRAATPAFSPSAGEREEYDIAGWDELSKLDPGVVTIGSHTLTHPILTSLSATQLETEVGGSRIELEAALQRPVEFFAYPNGDHDAEVCASVRAHYRSAVTTQADRLSPACDLHRLPRDSAPDGALRLALKMHRVPA